ncbi:MAG: mandelate racemase/muconate lactonizing enzyme family protein [Ardenticatenaceae bacterium]|nr:mandelate racemase/muconate lactonizing enzyme family protein [Ardenticatenaceae bacterium]HBY96661.1 mandelate racemase/muconate lactonizing enzyme family protein [Chloroflexota bacterium]
MKIVDVVPLLLSYTYPETEQPHFAGGRVVRRNAALVQVSTDEGLTGLGEVGSAIFLPDGVEPMVARFKGLLRGESPLNTERLWQRLYAASIGWGRRGLAMGVISAIDSALWDLAGQAAGVPVYDLLGGLYHDRLRVYASFIPKQAAALLADVQRAVDEGFTAVKIKLGAATYPGGGGFQMGAAPDLAHERLLLGTIREAIGARVDLLVDAAQAVAPQPWPVPTAVQVARLAEEFGAYLLEEPCGADDLAAHSAVARAVDVPVAAGENLATRYEFQTWLDAGALDILQPDVTVAGGLTEARKIAALAEYRHVPLIPHIWWTGVGMMANLHFAVSTPGCVLAEHSRATYPLREELLSEPLALEDGHVILPRSPGLGVRLPEDLRERYRYVPGPTFVPDAA